MSIFLETCHFSEESQYELADTGKKKKEDGRGEFCLVVSLVQDQRMVGVMDSLGTAGRRAGHTRLQWRDCPSHLGRSAGPSSSPSHLPTLLHLLYLIWASS